MASGIKRPRFLYLAVAGLMLTLLGCRHAESRTMDVYFFDVGYGDAIAVRFSPNRILLIDAGDVQTAQELPRLLNARNIRQIDYAIISHPHKNHYAGFWEVIKKFPIVKVFVNGDFRITEDHHPNHIRLMSELQNRDIPILSLSQKTALESPAKGVSFKVFHPNGPEKNVNEQSLVFKITFKDTSFLFTSDIGPKIQDRLIEEFGEELQADVVQIPHHGGPISKKFAEFFKGSIFVVSTGENPWGLPREEQMDWLEGTLYRTDRNGTIHLISNGEVVTRKES